MSGQECILPLLPICWKCTTFVRLGLAVPSCRTPLAAARSGPSGKPRALLDQLPRWRHRRLTPRGLPTSSPGPSRIEPSRQSRPGLSTVPPPRPLIEALLSATKWERQGARRKAREGIGVQWGRMQGRSLTLPRQCMRTSDPVQLTDGCVAQAVRFGQASPSSSVRIVPSIRLGGCLPTVPLSSDTRRERSHGTPRER